MVADIPTRVALVIGVNNYQYLPRLANPVLDAAGFHKACLEAGGFQEELCLRCTNPTYSELVGALVDFRKRVEKHPGCIAVIYFAGLSM